MLTAHLWPALAAATGSGCDVPADGALAEPVAAVTSLAFVVAGVAVTLGGRAR